MARAFAKELAPVNHDNDGLIDPFVYDRYDVCPVCKAQRIELFSFKNLNQFYSEAVDAHLRGYLIDFNYEIRTMKCQACGTEFMIDWDNGFPRPLRDNFKLNRFIQEFLIGI